MNTLARTEIRDALNVIAIGQFAAWPTERLRRVATALAESSADELAHETADFMIAQIGAAMQARQTLLQAERDVVLAEIAIARGSAAQA